MNLTINKFRFGFLALLLICLNVTVFAKYSGGSGDPCTPYQIANVADLMTLANDTNDYDKCFIMTADIDLDPNIPGNQVFTTAVIAQDTNSYIYNHTFDGNSFAGVFDGGGHKILNLTIDTNGAGNDYLGLFGDFNRGEIKNLGLENVKISSGTYSDNVGGLVGRNWASISNCFSTGNVNIAGGSGCGGLVGENESSSTIRDSHSACNVTAGGTVGGLAGLSLGTINNCFSSGTVTSGNNTWSTGGLVGYNLGTINNCFSSGAVTSGYNAWDTGGLVGYDDGNANNSFSTSNVRVGNSSSYTGGLVGSGGDTVCCFSTGSVSSGDASEFTGGFVGQLGGGSIRGCYSTGAVTGGDSSYCVGGFAGVLGGEMYTYASISYSYSIGDVNNGSGFIGAISNGEVSNCYSTGKYDTYGFIGSKQYGYIINSYYLGSAGPHNSYGIPLSDTQMKQRASFLGWGWDFLGETADGTADIWTICEGIDYPHLVWEYGLHKPDLNGDKFVNFIDFALLAHDWRQTSNPCNPKSSDINNDGQININDLVMLANYWLTAGIANFIEPNLPPGLVGWWKFDEGSGSVMHDSASGNDGYLYGGTANWVPGKVGDYALDITPGIYVEIPDNDLLTPADEMTLAFWAYYRGTDFFISKYSGYYGNDWYLNVNSYLAYLGSDNTVQLGVYSSENYCDVAYETIPLNGWHHIAMTFHSGQLKAFMDGVLSSSVSVTATSIRNDDLPLIIGGWRYYYQDSFGVAAYADGMIDDLRIYNRALSSDEVAQLYCYRLNTASNPNPANGQTNVERNTILSWSPGFNASTHDVYFGTNSTEVANADSASSGVYMGNKDVNYWDTSNYAPAGLDYNTTYYWRIDEVNVTRTPKGDVWHFTTVPPAPGQAGNPAPGNGVTGIGTTTDISWTAGSYAVSHDVYFGTANPPPFHGNQTGTTYDTGIMAPNTTYYWQIDEKNISGTTTGILWSFTTGAELVGWWKFDEGSGSTAYDSACSNNGTLHGVPDWIAGKVGNYALDFNGTGDYVEANDAPSLDMDSAITIAAWIKLNNLSKTYYIVSKKPSGSSISAYPGNYTLSTNVSTGKLNFSHETGSVDTPVASYTSDSNMSTGIWHHVAVTLGSGYVNFYIDGVSAGTFTQSGNFGIVNDGPVKIGTRKGSTTYFNGSMDDVRIYNRALTAIEVALLYQYQ